MVIASFIFSPCDECVYGIWGGGGANSILFEVNVSGTRQFSSRMQGLLPDHNHQMKCNAKSKA